MAISSGPPLSLRSLDTLDQVQHLDELLRFDGARFVAALEADLGAGEESLPRLASQLDALHQALLSIEPFTRRSMAIRLTHVLATEPAPPQLRTLLSATVISYAEDRTLLQRRFERSLSADALQSILAAADAVLALRQLLRDGIFAIGRRLAIAQEPWLKNALRNRALDSAQRISLRLARLDLQLIAEQPEHLASESCEARRKRLPLPDEEIEPTSDENRRFSLLEID